MKALTIWQPWASLWIDGDKDNETRSRPFNYRGPIAIHAAKFHRMHPDLYLDIWGGLQTKGIVPVDAPYEDSSLYYLEQGIPFEAFGVVLGTAELVDCIKMDEAFLASLRPGEEVLGDYVLGRYALKIENVRKFDKPIPARGAQGLWNWDERGLPA